MAVRECVALHLKRSARNAGVKIRNVFLFLEALRYARAITAGTNARRMRFVIQKPGSAFLSHVKPDVMLTQME